MNAIFVLPEERHNEGKIVDQSLWELFLFRHDLVGVTRWR